MAYIIVIFKTNEALSFMPILPNRYKLHLDVGVNQLMRILNKIFLYFVMEVYLTMAQIKLL